MSTGTAQAPPNANGNGTPKKQELTKEQQQFINLRSFFSSKQVQDQLKMTLPKHVTADRMTRVLLTAMSKQPKLLECTRESLILSLLQASELGLEPNGYDAHIIPYKNKGVMEAQFQTDYKGLVKLAYQSGMVQSVTAMAVYQADDFRYKLGTNEFLDHIPADAEDRGELTYAWAMVKLENGGTPFVVLNRSEVMSHKAASKSKGSDFSPWNRPETEPSMWAKSAFRVLSKFIPRSPELQKALVIEAESEVTSIGGVSVPTAITQEAPIMLTDRSSQSDELADALQARMMGGQQIQEAETVAARSAQPASKQSAAGNQPLDQNSFEAQWLAKINACVEPDALAAMTSQANDIADDGVRVRVHERLDSRRKEIAGFKGNQKGKLV